MAQVTRLVQTFGNSASGEIQIQYNDAGAAPWPAQQILVYNRTGHTVWVTAVHVATGTVYGPLTCPAEGYADQPTTQQIPPGQASQAGFVIDARGRVDGFDWTVVSTAQS